MRMTLLAITIVALLIGAQLGYSEAWLWLVLGLFVISLCLKRLRSASPSMTWALSLTISAVLAMMIWW